jgi:hypothetical protein
MSSRTGLRRDEMSQADALPQLDELARGGHVLNIPKLARSAGETVRWPRRVARKGRENVHRLR